MRITATVRDLKVAYRQPGRLYGVQKGENEVFDDGVSTSYPFDEATVTAGGSFDLPVGGELVFVKELGLGGSVAGQAQIG